MTVKSFCSNNHLKILSWFTEEFCLEAMALYIVSKFWKLLMTQWRERRRFDRDYSDFGSKATTRLLILRQYCTVGHPSPFLKQYCGSAALPGLVSWHWVAFHNSSLIHLLYPLALEFKCRELQIHRSWLLSSESVVTVFQWTILLFHAQRDVLCGLLGRRSIRDIHNSIWMMFLFLGICHFYH